MSLETAVDLARRGRLYPGVILHGADAAGRLDAALRIARTLLCELPAAERPCAASEGTAPCRHCRRIGPGGGETFHPDFRVVERDLKTSTSVEAVKEALKTVQWSPFEARGQVLVLASAETLTPSAANALLKSLEEPPTSAPRHFLLLTPAATDLLETLRSRSMPLYLGAASQHLDEADQEALAAAAASFAAAMDAWRQGNAGIFLGAAAAALLEVDDFSDPRALRPWSRAARVVRDRALSGDEPALRRALLQLAHDLLEAPEVRMRSIAAPRIVEGLVSRALAGFAAAPAGD
ncbi:MAG: hypothetical protein DWQ36_00070 [Acidobacteria bacterium]|nr:MAG: hypothetical protein DWQ30_05880 [Acidobacteriota bacterium]REK12101.1 MAG: hypothetical protein DWQ36_00070 [Acidobacteriota bacterium]